MRARAELQLGGGVGGDGRRWGWKGEERETGLPLGCEWDGMDCGGGGDGKEIGIS